MCSNEKNYHSLAKLLLLFKKAENRAKFSEFFPFNTL